MFGFIKRAQILNMPILQVLIIFSEVYNQVNNMKRSNETLDIFKNGVSE